MANRVADRRVPAWAPPLTVPCRSCAEPVLLLPTRLVEGPDGIQVTCPACGVEFLVRRDDC